MHRRLSVLLFVSACLFTLWIAPAYAADITVNTLLDGNVPGFCSLREAIASANADNAGSTGCAVGSGADRIVLGVTGDYTLTTGFHLSITSEITIEEAPGVTAIIQAHVNPNTATWRVFDLPVGVGNLTLNGLTVRHGGVTGIAVGGCIRAEFAVALRLDNSTVEACSSQDDGGGISTSSTNLTIIDSTVQNNTAVSEGGGLHSNSAPSITINGATFSGNSIISTTSFSSGGGAYIINTNGDNLNIDDTTFSENSATATTLPAGGGLSLSVPSGSASFSGLTFTDNEVSGGSSGYGGGVYKQGFGALTITNSVFTGNNALSINIGRSGGAIQFWSGANTVTNSRFDSNNAGVAARGGAIGVLSTGTATITGSCFTNNGDTGVLSAQPGSIIARDVSGTNDNWWGSSWGPRIVAAGGGSAVSSGDSINENGEPGSNVDVGLTSAGTPTTQPTGDWRTTAPTVAGALCQAEAVTHSAGDLTVTVPFQGRPAAPNARLIVPLSVILKPTGGGDAVINTTLTTDVNGVLTIEGVYAHVDTGYTLWVKGLTTLAHSQVLLLDQGSNAMTLSAMLREGDASNNNAVTLPDFSLLAAAFGTATGQAGFDARADFNGDGSVTLPDFSLLASNFGTSGMAAP